MSRLQQVSSSKCIHLLFFALINSSLSFPSFTPYSGLFGHKLKINLLTHTAMPS